MCTALIFWLRGFSMVGLLAAVLDLLTVGCVPGFLVCGNCRFGVLSLVTDIWVFCLFVGVFYVILGSLGFCFGLILRFVFCYFDLPGSVLVMLGFLMPELFAYW